MMHQIKTEHKHLATEEVRSLRLPLEEWSELGWSADALEEFKGVEVDQIRVPDFNGREIFAIMKKDGSAFTPDEGQKIHDALN